MADDLDPSPDPNRAPAWPDHAAEPQLDLANLPDIAAWIAQTAAEGIIGSVAFGYMARAAAAMGDTDRAAAGR